MAGTALLDMLSPDPAQQAREIAALRQIAMLREQGIPDAQIYAGLADPSFTQAGGYGFLPYITDLAGISSSYNLGRGSLALQASADEYQRQGNPYNVVSALQNMRDTNNTAVLTDPTLQNVQPGPAGIYQDYLRGLFDDDKGPQVAATTGTVANTANPIAEQNNAAVQRVRDQMGDQQAQQIFQNFANYDAARQGGIAPPSVGQAQQPVPTAAETGAQSAAARLVGGSIKSGTIPQFTGALAQGNVPGFSSINERDFNTLLSPDQRASYMGLVGSTGRVSDPMAAYQNYLRTYNQGGSQGARTYR